MADHLYALPNGYRLEEYEIKEVLSVGSYGIKYLGFDHRNEERVAIKEYLPDRLAVRQDAANVNKTVTEVKDSGRQKGHTQLYRGTEYVVQDDVAQSPLPDRLAVRQEEANVLPRSTADKTMFDVGRTRFLEDARVQARINEPNLVRIHKVLRANGTGYVVMDYVEGETLAQALARRGTLPEADMHAIVQPLLGPLELVHSMGFVHQDIRPGVIVLRTDGTPVLLDLGTGRRTLAGARQTTFGDRKQSFNLATPSAGFSALELYADRGRLGPWTDIYSLGAVMYNCLVGRPPPDAPSRAIEDELVPIGGASKQVCAKQTREAIESALALPAGRRPASIEAWRSKLPYGSADAEPQRPGHMARGATRVSARGMGGPPRKKRSDGSGSQRKRSMAWVVPTLAVIGVATMLTYVDVGMLRSCEGEDCNAAPSAAQPLLASLTVRTEPADAEVFVGDRSAGRTPLELTDLPAGDVRLTLDHPLYENVIVDETLTSGQTALVERTLVRATGALSIASEPSGAWIEAGGALVGTTPTTLDDLPAGDLTLTLGAQDYRSQEVAAVVRKAETTEITVSLESSVSYGTLTLTPTPADATITLPDIAERYTPGMPLPQGTYSVIVSRQGYRSETRRVEVSGDARLAVALAIDPQPFTVVTTPAQASIRFPISGETYSPDMPLAPGSYRVQAVLLGYRTWEDTVAHGSTPTRHEVTLEPGIAEFADRLNNGDTAPTMVLVASGQFRMGCLANAGCRDNEVPARAVEFAAPFALSKFEVTFNDYDRFTEATGRPRAKNPRGWQRGNWPVVNVSWQDAAAYAEWLSVETNRTYRLPSEAEWEYAARAGTSSAYSWGDAVGSAQANCNGCGSRWDNMSPAAVGSFDANRWGLHDMQGNVWEWVQDCQRSDYSGAPNNAAPYEEGDCKRRVLRGGSYSNSPTLIRASIREWEDVSLRVIDVGFRVAAAAD